MDIIWYYFFTKFYSIETVSKNMIIWQSQNKYTYIDINAILFLITEFKYCRVW